MESENMVTSNNPLSKYFRQPAIYSTLPSGGDWYPEGSLKFDNAEAKELAVFPMTAKDEMSMNTPDSLMNGQSVVNVISSCVPGIIDPWLMPIMDMDTVMIAIRIATYGHDLTLSVTIPEVLEAHDYSIDLRTTSDLIDRSKFDDYVPYQNLSFRIQPTNYKQLTNMQLRSYEQQRLVSQVVDSEMKPAEKQQQFVTIFENMTDITITNMKETLVSVTADGETVTDRNYIEDFVDNMDGGMADSIKKSLSRQANIGKIQPIDVSPPKEMVERGAPESFKLPIVMDNSNFFVSRS